MPKRDSPPTEQEHHRLAFEQYYALGPGRTYQQLAQKLGVSASTVKLWSRRLGWRQRVGQRDGEAARQVADRSAQATVGGRERDLRIVRMAKMKLTKDIAEGKVKGKVPDLEMLIRLEDYLVDSHGDPILAALQQLPQDVRDRLLEMLRTRLIPLANSTSD